MPPALIVIVLGCLEGDVLWGCVVERWHHVRGKKEGRKGGWKAGRWEGRPCLTGSTRGVRLFGKLVQ